MEEGPTTLRPRVVLAQDSGAPALAADVAFAVALLTAGAVASLAAELSAASDSPPSAVTAGALTEAAELPVASDSPPSSVAALTEPPSIPETTNTPIVHSSPPTVTADAFTDGLSIPETTNTPIVYVRNEFGTGEHSVEDETADIRRPLRISSRRASAPARMRSVQPVRPGDSLSIDSYSPFSATSSYSERTLDSATGSSTDEKSPFAEAGSWAEAWESWLHPAATLSANATLPTAENFTATDTLRALPPRTELRVHHERSDSAAAGTGAESSEKTKKPAKHCLGCVKQSNPGVPSDRIPFFDKAVVLPRLLQQDLLFIVTMDPGSVLLITSNGPVCHEADPKDLDKHVYAANAALDSCDYRRLLTWGEVYTLIPPAYIIWHFDGHHYFFRKPDVNFLEKHSKVAFCFTLEDVETHKVATFVVTASGVGSTDSKVGVFLGVILTVFIGVLSDYY